MTDDAVRRLVDEDERHVLAHVQIEVEERAVAAPVVHRRARTLQDALLWLVRRVSRPATWVGGGRWSSLPNPCVWAVSPNGPVGQATAVAEASRAYVRHPSMHGS